MSNCTLIQQLISSSTVDCTDVNAWFEIINTSREKLLQAIYKESNAYFRGWITQLISDSSFQEDEIHPSDRKYLETVKVIRSFQEGINENITQYFSSDIFADLFDGVICDISIGYDATMISNSIPSTLFADVISQEIGNFARNDVRIKIYEGGDAVEYSNGLKSIIVAMRAPDYELKNVVEAVETFSLLGEIVSLKRIFKEIGFANFSFKRGGTFTFDMDYDDDNADVLVSEAWDRILVQKRLDYDWIPSSIYKSYYLGRVGAILLEEAKHMTSKEERDWWIQDMKTELALIAEFESEGVTTAEDLENFRNAEGILEKPLKILL